MEQIKVVNLEKYNPRKDRTKHSWVRVDNTIAFSEDLDGLDPDQKWFWIYLISQASFKQRDWLDLNLEYFEKHSGVSIKKMRAAIEHFKKREMIQIVPHSVTTGNQSVSTGYPTDETDVTNVTNITDDTIQQVDEVEGTEISEFFKAWNSLPFKIPKAIKLTKDRRKKIGVRLKEASLDEWKVAMHMICEFPFLMGQTDNGDWVANLDWLIANETNRIKILEGKYKTKNVNTTNSNKAQSVVNRLKDQAERIAAGEL